VDGARRRGARVPAIAAPTPLEPAPEGITDRREVFLKREDVHELGAFKWRGALPTLEEYRANGASAVVTASTGNHAAATAWAARRLGLRALVYVPASASPVKLALIERFRPDLRLVDGDFDETKETARRAAEDEGLPFFEDGVERAQYDGYRAIGAEILAQMDEQPAAIVVPVGNGALLGGIALEICSRSPETRRIGVVPRDAPAMAESWEAGHPIESERAATFADGLAVRIPIPFALDVLGEVVSRMVLVSERAMAEGIARFAQVGIRVEAAAAAALAALTQLDDVPGAVVLVLTGRNIDEETFRRAVARPETFPD
jgi:threonine dehydratase